MGVNEFHPPKVYSLDCDVCGAWFESGSEYEFKGLEKRALEEGWAKSKEDDWICPACIKKAKAVNDGR